MAQPLFLPPRPAPARGLDADGPSMARAAFDRRREVTALLLFVAAVFFGLAIASFRGDALRPELHGPDWMGPAGATLAGSLVSTLGIVAWFVPLELMMLTLPFLQNRASIATVARLAGDVIVACILAALLHIALPGSNAFGAMAIAGSFGELFGELMRSMFSTAGSYLMGLTAIALILIGRASFSFIAWAQRTGRGTAKAGQKAVSGVRAVADAWATARELEREEDEATPAAPRISKSEGDDAIIAVLADEPDLAETRPPRVKLAPSAAGLDETGASSASFARAAVVEIEPPPRRTSRRAPRDEAKAPAKPIDELAPVPAEVAAAEAFDADAGEAIFGAEPSSPSPSPIDAGDDVALDAEMAAVAALESDDASRVGAKRSSRKKAPAGPVIVDTSAAMEVRKADPAKVVPAVNAGFRLPSPELLEPPPPKVKKLDDGQLVANAKLLVKTLKDYGVEGTVEEIHPGPTVTTYEVTPQAGTKVSKVASLADDLALGLSRKVRIIAPIPGKNRIGFEIQNESREPVSFRELVEDERFMGLSAPLPVVLGRDHVGNPFFADLASMPHVIVAGATGAGKSVGLNVMLTSLLYRRTPDELRLLMIDPKVVELAPFDRIPHMLLPVVTDMKLAANALKWAVDEMERRYQLFANAGTKNVTTYNAWVDRVRKGEAKPPPPPKKVQAIGPDGEPVMVDPAKDGSDVELPTRIPYIVIVVDEFADLMMQQGKDVEAAVARLAQKARAAGMHVIVATQRPSVDVITGMIKANFPTRIAFRVSQKVDSRTILDEQGAEHLLGRGDMLVKLNGTNDMRRVQCPFVSEEEVQQVTDFLRLQGTPVYDESILKPRDEDTEAGGDEEENVDPLYDQAVRIVADTGRCSTSWLQRKLNLGYNRAARIVEVMEKRGIVGPANGAREREVLISSL